MFKKILKLKRLIDYKTKYPKVRHIGAPFYLRCLGFSNQTINKGFYSQSGQDLYIFTEFFKYLQSPDFPRIFVDVGCNHPTVHSNSFFFESTLGYRVIAIDALAEVSSLWSQIRPNAQFLQCAVGNKPGDVDFEVVRGPINESMFSSVSGYSSKKCLQNKFTRVVNVRRLDDIFISLDIQRAGIVSMDIEGYELQALEGIDFTSFSASIFVIENNGKNGLGDDHIRTKMKENGYVYYARFWNLDDIFVRPECIKHQL
jgi:FkbM family methyltransferase